LTNIALFSMVALMQVNLSEGRWRVRSLNEQFRRATPIVAALPGAYPRLSPALKSTQHRPITPYLINRCFY
jgi:hypothetical protein